MSEPDAPSAAQNTPATWLDTLLRLAADVRPGESITALLLSANVFLLLAAYYVIRPVRDALILSEFDAAIRSYAGAVLAVTFMLILPAYGRFASRVSRVWLVNGMTVFFVSNLILFFLIGRAGVSVGVSFYLWASIFNLMVMAQFWSFANDVYTEAQGKRLFPIVGFGQAVGAVAGSAVSLTLFADVDLYTRLLIAAGALSGCLILTNVVHLRERRRRAEARTQTAEGGEERLAGEGGFRLMRRHRYLMLIGVMTLMIQFVNTNGEYILAATITETAVEQVGGAAGGATAPEIDAAEGALIAEFYAGFQLIVNILSLVIQFFLVSRIFKYIGVSQALFIMPVLSMGSYGLMAAAPVLAFIRGAKILENATDYSLQNTTRRALFLRTSREAKYKVLQTVETFFWRSGDALSGLAIFLLVGVAGLGVRPLALFNIGLVVIWLLIARAINERHKRHDTGDVSSAE